MKRIPNNVVHIGSTPPVYSILSNAIYDMYTFIISIFLNLRKHNPHLFDIYS